MKRFPFLDWMRGLAVVLMIQCHTFNSFAKAEVRDGGPYVLSQFVGGMAAPLFLFMAGMTLGFQMESLSRRQIDRMARWRAALRRGLYVLWLAFLFRLSGCVASLPRPDWSDMTKVDILNAMGVAMVAMSAAALFDTGGRARFALAAGLAVAAAAPIVANLQWGGAPSLLHEYLAPGQGRGRFPFFPNAAYIGFGISAGTLVKTAAEERFERLMQWAVLVGLAAIFTGQYFSNIPYSVYSKSSFWTDSPALVVIRGGIILALMTASYLWTEHATRGGWSWMQSLGKNSLMVYWVHVMLVYGDLFKGLKRSLTVPMTGLATVTVTALMVALSAGWQWRKALRAERWRVATSVAGQRPETARAI